jgi:hypothetical protein
VSDAIRATMRARIIDAQAAQARAPERYLGQFDLAVRCSLRPPRVRDDIVQWTGRIELSGSRGSKPMRRLVRDVAIMRA